MTGKYASLEQAQTDLRVSMMDKNGRVSDEYGKTLSVATDLGNKLPGTTKDFVLEAQALKQMGIGDGTIANGGLRAAGMLRVGMKLQGEGEAGMLVGKTIHAFGLKDNELDGATDQVYRVHKAFGQKGGDILAANTYMSGSLNQLGWTGFENMKKVQAIQGMMAMKGLDASVFGTNFADMLTDAAQIKTRLKGKGAEVKEVNHTLASRGIKLDFFDKNGQFVDPDGFVKQLEKLKPLTPEQLVPVLHKLFGTQGARVATHIVQGGGKAVQDAQEKVNNQLDVNRAVDELTKTFEGKAGALGGSIENLAATLGQPIGDALKPSLDKLNDWAGKLTETFKENPMAAAAAAIGTASAAAAAAMGLFGLAISSGIGVPVRVVGNGAPSLPGGGVPPTGIPPAGGGAPPAGSPPPSKWGSRLGLVGTASAAIAPLAAMYGVSEWAGDTSNDKGRVDVLQGVSGVLASLLAAIGIDKSKEIEQRRAEMRAELEVTVRDDRVSVSKTRLEGTNMTASMNTGNLWQIP
jgi:TP901 family phage tail tape measure protein